MLHEVLIADTINRMIRAGYGYEDIIVHLRHRLHVTVDRSRRARIKDAVMTRGEYRGPGISHAGGLRRSRSGAD